jgi:hypothetical protein
MLSLEAPGNLVRRVMRKIMKLALPALVAYLGLSTIVAGATGTLTILQPSGERDVYNDVEIKVLHGALYLTSADAKGTIIIDRAACSYQAKLMVCLATGATLVQAGETSPLDFKQGTVYLNDTGDYQPMVLTSAKVPPHSVVVSFTTKRGTYLSVNGRIDKVVK